MTLLERIGCPWIDLAPFMDDSDKLTALYLEHRAKGKELGYTPVFMDRMEDAAQWLWDHFQVDEPTREYAALPRAILKKVDSKSWPEWFHKIHQEYVMWDDDLEEDDPLYEYGMQLASDTLPLPSDAEYEAMIRPLQLEKLRIEKWPGLWSDTKDEIFYVDEDDVLALIPVRYPWQVMAWLPIGGFNWCPTPEYQTAFAKHMYEAYGAEIMSVHGVAINYYLETPLTQKEQVYAAVRDLAVMDDDWYQDIEPRFVYGKQRLYLWWD